MNFPRSSRARRSRRSRRQDAVPLQRALSSWMNVLREPVERDLPAGALGARRFVHLGAYGRELLAEAEIVDEAGDLIVASPAGRPPDRQVGQRRQGFPVDGALERVIFDLEARALVLLEIGGGRVVLDQVRMDDERGAAPERVVVRLVALHAA